MSSSNQRPANRGFRSVLRCALSHFRQFPCLSAPEPPFAHLLTGPQMFHRHDLNKLVQSFEKRLKPIQSCV